MNYVLEFILTNKNSSDECKLMYVWEQLGKLRQFYLTLKGMRATFNKSYIKSVFRQSVAE